MARTTEPESHFRAIPVEGARQLLTFRVPPYPPELQGLLWAGAIVRIIQGRGADSVKTNELVEALHEFKPARVTVLPAPRGTAAPAEAVQRARSKRTPRQVVEELLRGASPSLAQLAHEIEDEEGL